MNSLVAMNESLLSNIDYVSQNTTTVNKIKQNEN